MNADEPVRILIATNNAHFGMALHQQGEKEGRELHLALNGTAAAEILDSHPPDVVMLDEEFSHFGWLRSLLQQQPNHEELVLVRFNAFDAYSALRQEILAESPASWTPARISGGTSLSAKGLRSVHIQPLEVLGLLDEAVFVALCRLTARLSGGAAPTVQLVTTEEARLREMEERLLLAQPLPSPPAETEEEEKPKRSFLSRLIGR